MSHPSKWLALLLISAGAASSLPAQGRLTIGDNAWIVIDNGAAVVIENPNPNAITVAAGGANIRSEAEADRIHWRIGTSTGAYTIPWTNGNGVKIPLTANITTPGTGSGQLILSTHADTDALNNWDNFDYRPSDVTNMGGFVLANNSQNVIDRFWRIECNGFTTAPQATLTFAYDDAERLNPGNTITQGTLFAQRFDVPNNGWLLPGLGTDNWPTLTVSAAVVSANFFRSWTLATSLNPLPVEGLSFQAQRQDQTALLSWEHSQPQATSTYTIERATSSGTFQALGQVPATSSTLYHWTDLAPLSGLNTYRIRLDDHNGLQQWTEVRNLYFGTQSVTLYPNPSQSGTTNLRLQGFEGQHVSLTLTDPTGRRIQHTDYQIDTPYHTLQLSTTLPASIYYLQIHTPTGFHQTLPLTIQ